jgi:hypothetical protein
MFSFYCFNPSTDFPAVLIFEFTAYDIKTNKCTQVYESVLYAMYSEVHSTHSTLPYIYVHLLVLIS